MQRSLRFAVSLRSGDYCLFEAIGPIGRRLFGWPPGFGVGVLGSADRMAAASRSPAEGASVRALSVALGKFTGDAPVR